jgi:membrane protein YdbS with pleckstrin-like domain
MDVALEAHETLERLDDGRPRPLDSRHVTCARLGRGLFALVLLLVAGVALVPVVLDDEPRPWLVVLVPLALLIVAGTALLAWFYPPLELRRASWRLTPAGLEIKSGVWFRHVASVPRARVQHTDVARGPIERRFGLATLVVYTAGHQHGEVRLVGLAHETAVAIRDALLAGAEPRSA